MALYISYELGKTSGESGVNTLKTYLDCNWAGVREGKTGLRQFPTVVNNSPASLRYFKGGTR